MHIDDVTATAAALPLRYDVAAAGLALVALVALYFKRRKDRLELPPGPSLDPIIGQLRTYPTAYQWEVFADWKRKWGDVIYTSVLGRPIVILNSIDAARELLDKRGANFSSRPPAVVYTDMLDWDNVGVLPYGHRFREHRKFLQQTLNPQAVVPYRTHQTQQARILLKALLREPDAFDNHLERFASANVVKLAYGHDIAPHDEKYVPLIVQTGIRLMDEGAPGSSPADIMPFLKHLPPWLPGAGVVRRTKILKKMMQNVKNVPYYEVIEDRKAGIAVTSMTSRLLDDYEARGVEDLRHENDIKSVAGAMFFAGVDTTHIILASFLLMMACHPENVRRAQAEIDALLHQERLPCIEDRRRIPYVDCILKEVLRIYAVAPLGVPHANLEDDTYRGKRIPKGSIILANIWQMMRDPKHFPNPAVFDPERFREKVGRMKDSEHGLNSTDPDDPSAMAFGFGRRICPGRYFADASLWLAMSHILAVYDIGPHVDEFGRPEKLEAKYTSGMTTRPMPFRCSIKPRNARCLALIEDAVQD